MRIVTTMMTYELNEQEFNTMKSSGTQWQEGYLIIVKRTDGSKAYYDVKGGKLERKAMA